MKHLLIIVAILSTLLTGNLLAKGYECLDKKGNLVMSVDLKTKKAQFLSKDKKLIEGKFKKEDLELNQNNGYSTLRVYVTNSKANYDLFVGTFYPKIWVSLLDGNNKTIKRWQFDCRLKEVK